MKVLYVATVVKKHIMQFHKPIIKLLKDEGWETAVAARNDYDNPEMCVIPYCDTFYDVTFERNPFNVQNVKAYSQLRRIINDGEYDIVHCHTPVGGLLTRLASINLRNKGTKVIYTAHGFHFYKGSSIKNWLFYYPVERICSRWTDVIITINKEDYALAQKRMKAKDIKYVPGVGIDLDFISSRKVSEDKKEEIRRSLGIKDNEKMFISVGELINRKNHANAIKALALLDDENWKYFICGDGELEQELTNLIDSLQLSERVELLGYRTDVIDLCYCADLFIFPSYQEGLPVALMEAIATKTACVGSNIRGNIELITNSQHLFDPNDTADIASTIKEGMLSTIEDIENDYANLQKFDINRVNSSIMDVYAEILKDRKL